MVGGSYGVETSLMSLARLEEAAGKPLGPSRLETASTSVIRWSMWIAILVIALISIPVAIWGFSHGIETGLMVIVGLASVLFFSALPVVLGARSRRRKADVASRERVIIPGTGSEPKRDGV